MDATNLPELRADGLVVTAPGGPEVLRWTSGLALPAPGPDEVLIDVAWAGVNRHDCNQRRRGPTPAHSDVPGLEVSGTVRWAGARAGPLRVGDAVCALVDGGGYATRVVAPAALAFAVPVGLGLRDAAALPEALFTVWHNFFGVAALGPGETVLIHGGTSGVGSLAMQLLAALGHRVAVTCGSDAKVAEARTLGAAAAFNYRTQDWVQSALDWTGGRGVDVVLDMAGATHAARNVQVLARRGRLVHLSPGEGADFVAPLRPILAKELRITGSLLRPLPLPEKALIAERLRAVALPLVAAGRVRPWVSEVFDLRQAAQAHARLESGQAMGKLVLEVPSILRRA